MLRYIFLTVFVILVSVLAILLGLRYYYHKMFRLERASIHVNLREETCLDVRAYKWADKPWLVLIVSDCPDKKREAYSLDLDTFEMYFLHSASIPIIEEEEIFVSRWDYICPFPYTNKLETHIQQSASAISIHVQRRARPEYITGTSIKDQGENLLLYQRHLELIIQP